VSKWFYPGAILDAPSLQELNAMKAPSHHIESEYIGDPHHLAGPGAALCVALGGAAVVVGAMLLASVPQLSMARYLPDFATLQSLIVG
jgi:hypothetical protein